jgi:hypothetical protein
MSSPSKINDMFVSLPPAARVWVFLWTYLAVSGWFSTYNLIKTVGEARRNEMIDVIMPEGAFVWTAAIMLLSSFIVIGLLFYGRYARKKKDLVKAAIKKYEETNVYIEPKLKFDPAVFIFWIGGSILNVLFSMCVLFAAIGYWNISFVSPILYILTGFGISFFAAVLMYLITQVMANGVLDAKAVKNFMKTVVGSPHSRKIVGTICKKLGIMDQEAVDRVYEKVKDRITSASYDDLTPDEVLIVNKAIEDGRAVPRP